jgi:sodium-dependent phosphate transporter
MWAQYTWVFGLSFIVAFICAFGIGANDVANSFGTSVGAKAITIFQAVCIASVCEFLGAVLLGANVTDTIKSNIAKAAYFRATPELLLMGMFCVMCTAAVWDNLSCHLEMPVSTTHTTIGAIVGMTVALRGFHAVVWSAETDAFPYLKGMSAIVLSWAFSPILSGICVTILYGCILRPFVLRSQQAYKRATFVIPVLVGITFFVIVYFIIQTGNKNKTWSPVVADGKAVWIAIIPSVVMCVFTFFVLVPIMTRKIDAECAALESAVIDDVATKGTGKDIETSSSEENLKDVPQPVQNEAARAAHPSKMSSWWTEKKANSKVVNALANNPVSKVLSYGSTYDCHAVVEEGHKDYDVTTANMWANCEMFDVKTEMMFRYLQVFSACVMSLAHGSNDVANAMGPFSAVYGIWSTQSLDSKSKVPEWILVIGGAGIVAGLALFGYKIMRVIGVKAARLTNSRGFCCELSTAIVVMVASRYGLPVSTTQTIMGAVWAIGLFEGVKGVNKKTFIRTWCGWVLTLVIAAIGCAGFTSLLMYSPQKTAADDIVSITKALGTDSLAMLRQINATQPGGLASAKTLNSTLKSAFYSTPHVASEEITNFNKILQLYNTTLTGAAQG